MTPAPDAVFALIRRWGVAVTARNLAAVLAGKPAKAADGRQLHGPLRRLVRQGDVLRLGRNPATYVPARW